MVRTFAEKEIAPIAQELDDKEEFSYALTKADGGSWAFSASLSPRNMAEAMLVISLTSSLLKRSHGSTALKPPRSPRATPWEFHRSITMEMKSRRKKWLPDLCTGEDALLLWPDRARMPAPMQGPREQRQIWKEITG